MGAEVETSHPAGWLADPLGRYQYRYWDGLVWTDQVSTNGTHETDPQGLAPGPGPQAQSFPQPFPQPTTPVQPAVWARPRPVWSVPVRVLILGGAALLLAGSFLPWARAEAGPFTATKNGIDGDGVLTLVLALAIALFLFLVRHPRVMAGLVVGAGGLATLVAVIDVVDVSNRANDLEASITSLHASVSVGYGLWIALVGGVIAVAGGIVALVKGPEPR
jgi:hypothetical protein